MPKVSVIIPVYNVERWLGECLDSLLAQTLEDIEIICVDDGSPDSCGVILDGYAKSERRVKVFHQENAGTGAARNRALDAATGEYVAFIDPDDHYPALDVLEALYKAAKANDADIAGGRLSEFTDANGSVSTPVESGDAFPHLGFVDYADYQSPYWFYCYIYRRSFLNAHRVRFPASRKFEDPIFMIRAMSAAGRFFAIDKVVYCYRTGHKKVDWAGNGAALQSEHLRNMVTALALCEANGFAKLFFRLAKQAFKHVPDARQFSLVESDLRDIYLIVRSSALVSAHGKSRIYRHIIRKAGVFDRFRARRAFARLPRKAVPSAYAVGELMKAAFGLDSATLFLDKSYNHGNMIYRGVKDGLPVFVKYSGYARDSIDAEYENGRKFYEACPENAIRPIAFKRIQNEGAATVFEWCEGCPLSESVPDDVVSQVTKITDVLHRLGMCHRDFHRGNMMVGLDGKIKVIDFQNAICMGEKDRTIAKWLREKNSFIYEYRTIGVKSMPLNLPIGTWNDREMFFARWPDAFIGKHEFVEKWSATIADYDFLTPVPLCSWIRLSINELAGRFRLLFLRMDSNHRRKLLFKQAAFRATVLKIFGHCGTRSLAS